MTLLVSLLMVVAHLYLGWRLVRGTGYVYPRKKVWIWPTAALATFYLLPVTGLAMYGTGGPPDMLSLPKFMAYWFWFGFVFSMQLCSAVVVLDLIKLAFRWKGYLNISVLNRYYGKILFLVTAAVFLFTGAKMYLDTTVIQTEQVDLWEPQWPESLDGLRIVHISDLQGDRYTSAEDIARYIERVNSLNPDLVIFTGDLISYGTDYIQRSADEFSRIHSTYGTYAVVGDHDYWAGLSNVEPALEERGISLLRDENRMIRLRDGRILLTGITQVYSKRADPSEVKRLTSDTSEAALRILASHQVSNSLLRQARANGYGLFLSGHTHGGQVRIPFFGMTFSASDLETEYVSGTYRRGDLLINVNNGLGFTLAPVRYNARPSVTLINLSRNGDGLK